MVRGLLFLIFAMIIVLVIAAAVYMIARGIYAVYRQLRREDILDTRAFRDLEDETRL